MVSFRGSLGNGPHEVHWRDCRVGRKTPFTPMGCGCLAGKWNCRERPGSYGGHQLPCGIAHAAKVIVVCSRQVEGDDPTALLSTDETYLKWWAPQEERHGQTGASLAKRVIAIWEEMMGEVRQTETDPVVPSTRQEAVGTNWNTRNSVLQDVWNMTRLGNLFQLTLPEQVIGLSSAQRSLTTYAKVLVCPVALQDKTKDTKGDLKACSTVTGQLPFSHIIYLKLSDINACHMVCTGHKSLHWRSKTLQQNDSAAVG